MIFPFGVSWLCTLLLWGCICSFQKGYNFAHGYSISDDEFSSHAGVLGPQISNQFHSGSSLNTNHDSVRPNDEMQAVRHQSFVSRQPEQVQHENNEDASSVTSLSVEMVQSEPDSGNEPDKVSVVPSAPSVQKYEHERSGYQHPFGLLVKEHTQKKTTDGISFPTIKDFKQFTEAMKSSFLTPGSDLSRHFQTAREIMENQLVSNNEDVKGESDIGYRSNSAKEGTAHDEASINEVWSEPMNAVFEQNEQGANYQMSSESLSVPDPIDSTASLIPTSVYDNQDFGPGSPLYPHPHLAATEHVSSNYGSFDNGGILGQNPDILTSTPEVRNEDDQSTSYMLPELINRPSQEFSYYSSKKSNITPLTSKKNVQLQYTPHSKDSLTGYQKPHGSFELGEGFQSEELGRVNPASVPNPASLNSYGKSLYVSAPRGQHNIPDYLPKHRERPTPSFQAYQPTTGKESQDINYTPTVHLLSGSVSSSSDNPSPQSSSGHVRVETSSPHDAQNQGFNRKQPISSHQVFTVKPSRSLHDSSRHNGHLGDQRVSVTDPSIRTDPTKDERSDPSEQNLASAIQEPKEMTDNTLIPISSGLDSTQSGISSLVGVDYASFNSLTNLAPISASETAFSRLVGNEARNFGLKNIILNGYPTSDIRGARNLLSSFSTSQRRAMSLNDGYVGVTRPGPLQTLILPTKAQKRPANVNKEPANVADWPPKPLSASKVSGSTLSGVFWRTSGNTKRLPLQTGPNMSPPSVNTYVVKSKSGYVRHKVSQSKTIYAPYQLEEGKTSKHQHM